VGAKIRASISDTLFLEIYYDAIQRATHMVWLT